MMGNAMDIFEQIDASVRLNDEERMLVEQVRTLARERIAPRAAGFDQSGEFPWSNVEDINALGLNAMFVPEAYGGATLSYATYLLCVREISAACAATGIIWATNFHGMKPVIDFGSEALKHKVLPRLAEGALGSLCITEPDAGSDATGMRTKFTPDGDQIVIDGGKTFITNAGVSNFYLVFGKWSEIDNAKAAITALVLEKGTPGLSSGEPRRRWATVRRAPLHCLSTVAGFRARICLASPAAACRFCSVH